MKRCLACAILGLFVATSGAEAGWLRGDDKLPKPAPPPMLRSTATDAHKVGLRGGNHPVKYLRPEWGSFWKYTKRTCKPPQHHSLFTR